MGALRLLFWPKSPLGIGRARVQGFVPARHHRAADALSRRMAAMLTDGLDVWAVLDTTSNREALFRGLRRELQARMGAWPAFPFRRQVAVRIEDAVVREVERYLDRLACDPDLSRQAAQYLPLADLIRTRLLSLDLDALERGVREGGRREFRLVGGIGALAGLVIGFLAPMMGMWAMRF